MRLPALALACTLACTLRLGSNSQATFVVGPQGAVIGVAGGLSLHLPAGALPQGTQITVTQSDGPIDALSPQATFDPALALAVPAAVSFAVDSDSAALYWNGETILASISAGIATAQVSRLGSGYFRRPPPGRTVSGRLVTIYQPDSGASATLGGALGLRMHVTALWVPGSTGYSRMPVVSAPDYSFSVPNVPQGQYFLEIDTLYKEADYGAQLFAFTTSTPDLSMIAAARPDVQIATHSPQVTLDISNLLPWVYPSGAYTGDLLMVAGSQANAFGRPHSVRPAAAATTWHGTFDWNRMATSTTPAGLPDVSKGDVEFIYQRATRALGGGVAHRAARYQRLDTLTLTDGTAASLSVALADAPQTGSLHVDVRGTQWAALAKQVNPAAGFTDVASGGVSILAVPHSLDFPNLPYASAATSVLWVQVPDGLDVNYGDVSYGQFLGPEWKELRYPAYFFESPDRTLGGEIFTMDAMPETSPIVPRLSPPRAPLVNGRDAFVAQTGVGTQPTLSWSPPSLGTATSYLVSIWRQPAAAGFKSLQMTVHGATSVAVPPGFLEAGAQYSGTIVANSAPWDVPDVPAFRTGLPLAYAECALGTFSP